MRVWEFIKPDCLGRCHLNAENYEEFSISSIIVNHKTGYSKHPEVSRWRGRMAALYARNRAVRQEMKRRGYNPRSTLHPAIPKWRRFIYLIQAITHLYRMPPPIDVREQQIELLRSKGCQCKV